MKFSKWIEISSLFYLIGVFSLPLFADSKTTVWVKAIEVMGNKKTKTALILRELEVKKGDTLIIEDLTSILEQNEKWLLNTSLFNDVEINIKEWNEEEQSIVLQIKVIESWYIFPIPILSLADRNFNVWWVEHNRSLRRLNYGIRFAYENFTGNRDKVKLHVQGGFKRRILLQYDRPYVNQKKTLGFTAQFFTDQTREFAYETRFNKQQFVKNDSKILFKSLKSILTIHYRPKIEAYHDFLIKFENDQTFDTINELNQDFFVNGLRQQFFEFSYSFTRERRDNRFYAIRGNYFQFWLHKEGLGIFNDRNKFYTIALYAHYFPISPKFNFEFRIKGKREWVDDQPPYHGLNALGYGEDYLRGYEYYVIDGTDYILNRNSIRFKFFDRTFDLKKKMPVKNYRKFPVTMWFTLNGDWGKVKNNFYNEENPFNNRFLFGKGLGLDIILYHQYVFQLEFSVNHLNEKGLFFHYRSSL